MQYRILRVVCVILTTVWLWPVVAGAQFGGLERAASSQMPGQPTISSTGMATLKRPPTAMRMHVELLAKGKTLEEALDKLKDLREVASVQLGTLKADPNSIEFGSPSLSAAQSAQKSQFEAMVRQRMSSRGKGLPAGLQAPKSVTVSMTLSAEWPLEADDPPGLLLAAQALQEEVKAADLAGSKDAEKLSPEEEELAEEMAAMMRNSGQEEAPLGQPQFLYVARISEQERDKVLAEAFGKAKSQAARLAQAAGAQLGPLVGLGGGGGGQTSFDASDFGMSSNYASQRYLRRLMGQQAISGMGEMQNEAMGGNPGSLTFAFYITASFGLKQ